jgi:hypothetical protein
MVIKQIEVPRQGDLVVNRDLLKEAGLEGRAQLIIRAGEIRIVPEPPLNAEIILDDLAGCLGQEPVENYDFQMKIGQYYEAR